MRIETDGVYANPVRDANGRIGTLPVEVALLHRSIARHVEVESTLIDSSAKRSQVRRVLLPLSL